VITSQWRGKLGLLELAPTISRTLIRDYVHVADLPERDKSYVDEVLHLPLNPLLAIWCFFDL
jgi:hypothetical protein